MKFTVKLIVLLSSVLLLSSCGVSKKSEEEQVFNEGVDTVCTVREYHTCSDADSYFIHEGDKVAVISPSSYPSENQRDAVMNGLKELGYDPVEGACALGETRTIEDIASDLKWALETPEIKAIFCIRGGSASSDVLDYMGLEPIRANPNLIFAEISHRAIGEKTLCNFPVLFFFF